jgi:NAD-dependent SIR2 family protein deacetylase
MTLAEQLSGARQVVVLTGAGVSAESGVPPPALERALQAASACDLFLVVGASAVVQPAASLPVVAREHGATVVEVNLEPTPLSDMADESHHGKAGDLLPRLLGLSLSPGPQPLSPA